MEKSEQHYTQLDAEERVTIMLMRQERKGVREIGRFLNRSPGTISRELDRDLVSESGYVASLAGAHAGSLRIKPRKESKLAVGGLLFGVVVDHLKKKWAPEQNEALFSRHAGGTHDANGGVGQTAHGSGG